MPKWEKEADWLPLSNAIAQVKFWKADLQQAEQFLEYCERLRKYNLPNWDKMYELGLDDVAVSREGLTKARFKLEQSKSLE
jgi:hypothetical protein